MLIINEEQIKRAQKILEDNGHDADDAMEILTAIGYILLDQDLYDYKGEPRGIIM